MPLRSERQVSATTGPSAGSATPVSATAAASTAPNARGAAEEAGRISAEELDQATEAASRAVVPLPSEPVGIGGRWQATQRVSQRGMEIDQTAVYEVLGLSDSHALLDVTIEQQLVSVSNVAGLGDEAGVTLGNFESRGTGRNTLNLAASLSRF